MATGAFVCICPSFVPYLFILTWFSCASISTLFQREDLNSELLVCACRNKYEQWVPTTFRIHVLVFTVTVSVELCSVTNTHRYFMTKFGNHWVCKALFIVLRVILHLSMLTTTVPCFPLVSNTEITCENFFSCHIH